MVPAVLNTRGSVAAEERTEMHLLAARKVRNLRHTHTSQRIQHTDTYRDMFLTATTDERRAAYSGFLPSCKHS